MQTFKIRQGGFTEIRKRMLIRAIPILLLAGAAGLAISSQNIKNKDDDVNVLPIVIPLAALALGVGLYRGTTRQKLLFESYILTITNNLITREQLNTPTISIYFNDIKEINKHKDGSFTVKGNNSLDLIAIPTQIDNYSQLETTLQNIQPVVAKENTSLLERYPSLSGLVTIGLMLCVYTVTNKIIVAITGTALLALMIWSFLKTIRNKNVDDKTKRSIWIVWIVIASVIAVMFFKLTATAGM